MNFGKNTQKLREERKLTQCELADRVGVTSVMINRIENGSKIPSLLLSLSIANVLNTTVDTLANATL